MGTVLWEALAGQRLFSGRTDLDVFKQIRNCEIRPLGKLRADLPKRLVEIIEQSLMADPGKRFPSARTMAVALADVLKTTASTGDAQQALGTAVSEIRLRTARQVSGKDEQPTASFAIEVEPVTITSRPPKPDETVGPTTARTRPAHRTAETMPAVDIEFSKPDIDVEPLELTTRKKP
jgi:eukaryotic-like serine/threonine-protein kinase